MLFIIYFFILLIDEYYNFNNQSTSFLNILVLIFLSKFNLIKNDEFRQVVTIIMQKVCEMEVHHIIKINSKCTNTAPKH